MKKFSYLLLSILLCSMNTYADFSINDDTNPYYFSLGVGYYHFSDKRDLENRAIADITVGALLSEKISVEAFYGQAATRSNSNVSARFYVYAVDGVYHFDADATDIFHPYLLSGLQVTNQDNNDAVGNTTLLGINTGVGVEYVVNSNISLFTDIRDLYTLSGGKNDWMLNGGIKFLFDHVREEQLPAKTDGSTGFYQLQEPVDARE